MLEKTSLSCKTPSGFLVGCVFRNFVTESGVSVIAKTDGLEHFLAKAPS